MKQIVKKIALAIFSFAMAVVVGDVFMTKFFPPNVPDSRYYYSPDPYFGWSYVKGAKLKFKDLFGNLIDLEFTPEGFRDWHGGAAGNSKIRIMYIGDSMTGGLQVNRKDHFIQLIDNHLADKGYSPRGYNYGVNGYSTEQVALVLERYVSRLRPHIVVYVFVQNDTRLIGSDRVNLKGRQYGKPVIHFKPNGTWAVSPPPFKKIELPVDPIRFLLHRSYALQKIHILFRKWRFNFGKASNEEFQKANWSLEWPRLIDERKPGGHPPGTWESFESLLVGMDRVSRKEGADFLLFPGFDPIIAVPKIRKIISNGGGGSGPAPQAGAPDRS
ncbi:SGNH/GDSL hydrolase family protein [Nitrospinota bacterium]